MMTPLLTHIERMTREKEHSLLEVALADALLDHLAVGGIRIIKLLQTPDEFLSGRP